MLKPPSYSARRGARRAGDVGQMIDPWVFAAWIAAQTTGIAIGTGTGSVILPLRSSVDLAKGHGGAGPVRLSLGTRLSMRRVAWRATNG